MDMADPDVPDLQSVLREQQELRLRLVALDRKIDALLHPAPAPVPAPLLTPKIEPTPPPLPRMSPMSPMSPMPVAAPTPIIARQPEVEPEDDTPPPLTPLTPLPAAPASVPVPRETSLEYKLGTVWLVRIGIVMLLTGLVFLGNYAWHHLIHLIGPLGKILLLYLAGGALAALGSRLEKSSENLRNYGRVLLAGGVAAIYYTTYAAAFVDRMRVIGSPLAGGLLLLLIAGAVVWLAEKRRSQSVALTAIVLSYYTSAINPLGSFALFSNLILTGAAVFFLLRHRWTTLSFLSLIGTYASFAFWRFYRTGEILVSQGQTPADFWYGTSFLLGYWVLFTVAVFFSRKENFPAEQRTPFLSLNNAAFFALTAPSVAVLWPHSFGRFCLGFGLILLVLAWLAQRRQNEDKFLDGAYLVQGLGVVTLGLVTELTGYQLSIALALQSTVLLCGMRRRHGWIYESAAGLVAIAAFSLLFIDENWATGATAVRVTVIGLFLFNAWLCKFFKTGRAALSGAYGALALLLLAPVQFHYVPLAWMEDALVATGLLLTVLLPLIGLGETAVLSQSYVFLGVTAWMFSAHPELAQPRTVAGVLLGPLALVHWWQRRPGSLVPAMGEAIFSLVLLGVMGEALAYFLAKDHLMAGLAGTAVVTLLYGIYTRTFLLGLLSQSFTVIAAGFFFWQMGWRHVAWPWATLTIAFVALDFWLLHLFSEKWPENLKRASNVLITALNAILFGLTLGWGWEYVAVSGQLLYFTGLAAIQLRLAAQSPPDLQRVRSLLIHSGFCVFVGLLSFWVELFDGPPQWLNFIGLFLLAVLQQAGRRWFSGTNLLPHRAGELLILAVVSGYWLLADRWIDFHDAIFPKTLAWALLALVSLGVGLALRERPYRLLGLALLALAILRIICVDVWQLESLSRILSFIGLSIVLLGLGFIYNKFADKLREWL